MCRTNTGSRLLGRRMRPHEPLFYAQGDSFARGVARLPAIGEEGRRARPHRVEKLVEVASGTCQTLRRKPLLPLVDSSTDEVDGR